MSRTILINASEGDAPLGEVRVAIIDNGHLVEFDVDPQWKEKTRGNIYRGIVTNVEPSLQAAFVDFGAKKQGFLSMSDVAPHAYRPDRDKGERDAYAITDALKRRQMITVQVQKEEIGSKGAALTTHLSLPGRYLVLMPHSDGAHVSRKIEDEEERRRVRQIVSSLSVPDDMGVIVRTAGMEQPREVLEQDLGYLVRQWRQIQERQAQTSGPALLMKDHDAIIRVLRDYLTPDVARIVVDTQAAFDSAYEFLQQVMPNQLRLLELYDGRKSLFFEFQIEAQVEQLFGRRATLQSGGYLIIDQTEALVSIDVNSGKSTREGSQEETAYRTNLEAVVEVARQLKLRDLGGIVVVDLIDMARDNYRAEVEKRFREATKNDKARFKISPISQHGILELTRQRIRPALGEGTLITCEHCEGRGKVRNIGSEGSYILRAIVDRLANELAPGQGGKVNVEVPTATALSLLNDRREAIAGIEYKHGVVLRVIANDHLTASAFTVAIEKDPPREQAAMPPRLETTRTEATRTEATRSEAPRAGPQQRQDAPRLAQEGDGTGGPKRKRRGRRGGKGKGGPGREDTFSDRNNIQSTSANDEDAEDNATLTSTRPPMDTLPRQAPREDNRHQGRPQGDGQTDDRKFGDRPQGDRPQSDRPQSDRQQDGRQQEGRQREQRPHQASATEDRVASARATVSARPHPSDLADMFDDVGDAPRRQTEGARPAPQPARQAPRELSSEERALRPGETQSERDERLMRARSGAATEPPPTAIVAAPTKAPTRARRSAKSPRAAAAPRQAKAPAAAKAPARADVETAADDEATPGSARPRRRRRGGRGRSKGGASQPQA